MPSLGHFTLSSLTGEQPTRRHPSQPLPPTHLSIYPRCESLSVFIIYGLFTPSIDSAKKHEKPFLICPTRLLALVSCPICSKTDRRLRITKFKISLEFQTGLMLRQADCSPFGRLIDFRSTEGFPRFRRAHSAKHKKVSAMLRTARPTARNCFLSVDSFYLFIMLSHAGILSATISRSADPPIVTFTRLE